MTEVTSQPSVLELFGLNGKLFFAQLVNFAIIIFVVAKWVYKPLLKAIDARDEKIQKGLKDADEAKNDRHKAGKEVQAMQRASQAEARAFFEATRAEAMTERGRLMKETQAELERQLEQARARLKEEKEAMSAALKKEAVQLIVAATEKVAMKTLDEKGQRELIQQALREVESTLSSSSNL